MLVLGDISGIQSYLFDVAESGGGQARRLRARSFFIQLLAEAAALRILRARAWPSDDSHFLLSGAGKFVLKGSDDSAAGKRLASERQAINDWLLHQTRGELRLTLAWAEGGESEVAAYRAAQRDLQRAKARPWAPDAGGGWAPDRLVLAPLDTPCSLCHHARAEEEEDDPDTGKPRLICRWCAGNRQLGQRLPQARWLVVRDSPNRADLELFGLGVTVSAAERVEAGQDLVAVANLRDPENRPPWCPPDRFLVRRLMAPVPVKDGKPVLFVDLAERSRGDRLLAVLKADADSLGLAIERLLGGPDLRPLTAFSRELDGFFAGRLKAEVEAGRDPRWREIYTIFAGGDDLVMVGPWDVMLNFAGRVHELFRAEFGTRGLTLSAGVALIRPKRPIKAAVAEAERLLEQAKTCRAPGEAEPKDQCAAFGQLWKWNYHQGIIRQAQELVQWVEGGQLQRGWLHTLLGLAEARHPRSLAGRRAAPDLLATARLAHHVARNYRRGTAARAWADGLVRRFDDPAHVDVRYLPAIVRYALTATRTPGEEE